jgi:hypothetical protein
MVMAAIGGSAASMRESTRFKVAKPVDNHHI